MALFSERSSVASLSPEAWFAVAISLVSGVLVAIMVQLNATLGVHIGVVASSWVVHVVGTFFAALLWMARTALQSTRMQDGGWRAAISRPIAWRAIPWYAWMGGVLGVGIVVMANVVVPVLGLALTLSVLIATSLTVSALADHFGLFGLPVQRITWRRALGIACIIAGVVCVMLG